MKCNLALWDRLLRGLFGVLLLVYLIAGGPLWSAFGFYLLFTAAWGLCPGYAFLKIRTLRDPLSSKAANSKPRTF